ncbi:hypothetical protein [Pseudonocardia kongjuensis]|uniref:hypothetical protein n=1 Tax=Pseudonocardia kongjuensis TaxID=102227 RepID=UPI0031D6FBE1
MTADDVPDFMQNNVILVYERRVSLIDDVVRLTPFKPEPEYSGRGQRVVNEPDRSPAKLTKPVTEVEYV